jgi:membrane protein
MHGSTIIGGLTVVQLAGRTLRESVEDKLLSRSAELAYYFLLSLFPLLIFLLSLISFIPSTQQVIINSLSGLMPTEASEVVHTWIENVFRTRSGSLLSFGIVFSLWAASTGMSALVDALNNAYEVQESRPFWKASILALGLTVVVCILIVGGASLIALGDHLAGQLSRLFGDRFKVWPAVRYLLGMTMMTIGLDGIYYLAPNLRQRWKWITPGAVFAVLGFASLSYLFSLYLKVAPGFDLTYGSLGAVIALMLWLYFMGLIVLVGAEINSEIDKARGKNRVERQAPKAGW